MKLTKTKYQLKIFIMYGNDFLISLVTKNYFLFVISHKSQLHLKLINKLINIMTYNKHTTSKLEQRIKRYESYSKNYV